MLYFPISPMFFFFILLLLLFVFVYSLYLSIFLKKLKTGRQKEAADFIIYFYFVFSLFLNFTKLLFLDSKLSLYFVIDLLRSHSFLFSFILFPINSRFDFLFPCEHLQDFPSLGNFFPTYLFIHIFIL